MDGDVVPLPAIMALKRRFDTLLFVDEAHSFGVLGQTGRGVGKYFDIVRSDVDIWMGTLSKSLASCGGYLAGEKRLIEYLRYTLPGFVFSVGLPPPQAAAALGALQCLVAEPERVTRLSELSDALRSQLRAQGINTGTSKDSAVVPWIVGDSGRAIRQAKALEERGVMVHPIIAPAVDERAARMRFFVTAAHSLTQIEETVASVAEVAASVS
jgi:8-amino-7-oxononanoate synthase